MFKYKVEPGFLEVKGNLNMFKKGDEMASRFSLRG
jgi:hypothetical protein